MLLKFALILVFTGLVLFVLSLRVSSKQDFVAVESLVDGLSKRLLKNPGSTGLRFLFLSLLQSMGCLYLGSKAGKSEDQWSQDKATLNERFTALEAVLTENPSAETLKDEFQRWQELRSSLALSLFQDSRLLKAEESDPVAPLELPGESATVQETMKDLPGDWDKDAWKELQEGAMRLGSVRWAFTDPLLLEADIRTLLEQCTLIYQSLGPGYSLLRHPLSAPQKAALDASLKSWTESLGQCFFNAQITLRLSRLEEAEDGRREQADECLALISKSLKDALGWIQKVEQDLFLQSFGALEEGVFEKEREAFGELAGELRTSAEALCGSIGQTVSEQWRVNEMIYGHPRGQELVESMGLKCKGCYVAESESLRSASMVHDFKVEKLLTALTEPR